MKSTVTQESFAYPTELIDLFILNIASNVSDVASCGLVSKIFYFPSRRHLFRKIRIKLTAREIELYSHDARRLEGILEILPTNVALREAVRHLVIEYDFPKYPKLRPGEEETMFNLKSNFRAILPLVPALQTLTNSAPGDGLGSHQSSLYNETLMSALADLRSLCPYLRHLELIRLRGVPISFILQWTNVIDLKLDRMSSILGDPIIEQSTLFQRLERLPLQNSTSFPESLQTIETGHLQYLQIGVFPMSPTLDAAQAWHLITRSSSVLNHLYLVSVFGYGSWPYSLSTIMVPFLQKLEIYKELWMDPKSPFPQFARFLMPKNTSFNIQSITISFSVLFKPEQDALQHERGWSELDAAFTSNYYQSLSKLEIHLNFLIDGCIEEELKQRISELLKDCSSRLLPLVYSSRSINLQFSILVRYSNATPTLTFSWDNHASAVLVENSVPVLGI